MENDFENKPEIAVNKITKEITSYITYFKECKDQKDGHIFFERWIKFQGKLIHPFVFFKEYEHKPKGK